MPDDFVRSGARQMLAFLFAVLCVDLMAFLGTTTSHGLGQLLAGGFVVGLYMFAFLLPFFLIDVSVIRPVMAGRVPLPVMVLVEFAVLIATQVLLRWRGIEAASGSELDAIIWRMLQDSGVFFGIYAVCTVIIKRLSSAPASAA